MAPETEHVPERRVRKLGIVIDDFAGLAGATDFIVSFVDGAVRAADGREVVLIVRHERSLLNPRVLARRLRSLLRRSRPSAVFRPEQLIAVLRDAGLPELTTVMVERTERDLAQLCLRERIDVVGPLSPPPSQGFPVPFLSYIYDFQHRHFPEYFSPEEVKARDALFETILERSDAVVVNAQAVKTDADRFGLGPTQRIVTLPFSASPKPEWFDTDTADARGRYGIGKRYFMVSNQFWIHKRHEVAIRAFARIARNDCEIELVLTGSTSDYRAPRRLEDIVGLIRALGITPRVHILGLVPKRDQIALMRGAVALIQPTSFEGGPGGGCVFDAIALGVSTVVSDIPVNREIAEHVTAYFPLDDVEALVVRLDELRNQVPRPLLAEDLLREGAFRRMQQGHAIWRAADLALWHRRALGRLG